MTTQGVRDAEGAPYLPTRPSADEQILFIASIERVLAEGSFVATYKYALLVSLVELAIERGDDSRRTLTIPLRDISEKFAELYWRQAAPFHAGTSDTAMVLHQSSGRQASAITRLVRLRDEMQAGRHTLTEVRRTRAWTQLVSRMRTLLRTMPLWRLQRVGREQVRFLYEPGPDRDSITLLPGVACHLRERAPLIRRLAETEWLRFILSLKQNQAVLGRAVGLSEFLFGSDRLALARKLTGPLREVQHGRCFYCERALPESVCVDHFIPWSRYPHDLAHNLVLAHVACNSRKRDLLAGETYLGRWVGFISASDSDLRLIGSDAGLLVDRPTCIAVANWSYGHVEHVGAEVWLGGSTYGHLSTTWRALLNQVRPERAAHV